MPKGLDGRPLGKHLDLMRDAEGRLGIEDVIQGEAAARFFPSTSNSPNLGYVEDAVWARLPLINEQDRPASFLLEVAYPPMDHVELFTWKERRWVQRVLGDGLPFHQREVKYRTILFPVDLAAGEQTVYYFRFKSTSSMCLFIAAWEPQAFLGNASRELLIYGAFFGIALAMCFFNSMVFLSTKDRGYLFQVLVIVHATLFLMVMSGLAFQYLWPTQVWWANHCLPFVIAFSNFWMLQFTRSFLGLKDAMPRQDRALRVFQWSCLLLGLLSPLVPYGLNIRLHVVASFLTVASILVVGTTSLIGGNRAARIFMLAWIGLILGNGVLSLKTFGILPDTFLTRHSAYFGFALLVLLISLALVDRMYLMKKDLEVLNTGLDSLVTKRTSELDLKNRELLLVNEQKNQFLGIVAHDLRNPLNGIVLAAELLDGEEDLGEINATAKKIKQEGMEMSFLIGRLLDFAAIEAGKIKAEPVDFDLLDVAQHVVARHTQRAKDKGITIQVLPFPGTNGVRADIKFTKEILENLISNAIKFSSPGKSVSVFLRDQGGQMQVSVQDQGPGLTASDKEKLFGRFAKLSARPTGGEKSIGLGLSIVKHLADLIGGRVWVESEPGCGATFHLELPKSV